MLLKCCTQYISKFGKQQWSQKWKRLVFIPIPKKEMPKNIQTTIHLCSFHMLVECESTLCDPMDNSPPSFSICVTLQARILALVSIPFSRGYSQPGIKPRSLALNADSLQSKPPGKPHAYTVMLKILQVRLQQYVNPQISDAQAGFR